MPARPGYLRSQTAPTDATKRLLDERTEIEDLLGDIDCCVNALDLLIADSLGQAANPLMVEAHSHETLGHSLRLRAERGLFPKSQTQNAIPHPL